MSEPAQKTTPVIMSVMRRPNLSPSGAAAREPKKQPACRRETMLAAKASCVATEACLRPKSLEGINAGQSARGKGTYLMNGASVIDVPMKAKS